MVAAIDLTIERITPLLTSADDKYVLSSLVKLREIFRDNLQGTVDALEVSDLEKAEMLLSTSTRDNLQEFRNLVDQLVKGEQGSMSAHGKEILPQKMEPEAALSRSRTVVIGLGFGMAIVGLLLGLMLMRSADRLQ